MIHSEILYIVVMSNIFDNNVKIDEKYDMKGSWVNRGGKSTWKPIELGKDNDFKKIINIGKQKKKKILAVIKKDIELLRDFKIMDYSLLLGIQNPGEEDTIQLEDMNENILINEQVDLDEDKDIDVEDTTTNLSVIKSVNGRYTYCLGIIDILQRYNSDKKSERCCKVYFLCKDKRGLSCIEPWSYCHRFYEKMNMIIN